MSGKIDISAYKRKCSTTLKFKKQIKIYILFFAEVVEEGSNCFLPDHGYIGKASRYLLRSILSPEECMSYCQEIPECKGFEYNEYTGTCRTFVSITYMHGNKQFHVIGPQQCPMGKF